MTQIKPSAIDTRYIRHARNYTPTDSGFPPPVYAPQTVAEAILFCAQHPRREVVVGGGDTGDRTSLIVFSQPTERVIHTIRLNRTTRRIDAS